MEVIGLTGVGAAAALWGALGQPQTADAAPRAQRCVDTLIFDIDDTLYPIDCNFTAHRNGPLVQDYMVKYCGFKTREEARDLRDRYFAKHHSTVKVLAAADAAGDLPNGKGCLTAPGVPSLSEWWATHCEFEKYLTPAIELPLIAALGELRALGYKLVIFTNGPKLYALRVLETLQLRQFFKVSTMKSPSPDNFQPSPCSLCDLWSLAWSLQDENIFSIEDVLPACKPQPEAFMHVLKVRPSVLHLDSFALRVQSGPMLACRAPVPWRSKASCSRTV